MIRIRHSKIIVLNLRDFQPQKYSHALYLSLPFSVFYVRFQSDFLADIFPFLLVIWNFSGTRRSIRYCDIFLIIVKILQIKIKIINL